MNLSTEHYAFKEQCRSADCPVCGWFHEQAARNIAHALAVVAAYSRGRYEGFHMLLDVAPMHDVPGAEKADGREDHSPRPPTGQEVTQHPKE